METQLELPALDRFLRDVVPCIDKDDPFAVQDYEQAIREWLAKNPFEREASGFAAHLSSYQALGMC